MTKDQAKEVKSFLEHLGEFVSALPAEDDSKIILKNLAIVLNNKAGLSLIRSAVKDAMDSLNI